ncbi:FMRFamide receptor [Biomphalaria glabrata]|nr:FMRFamide receptor [Biomphalaria glabrata]
MTSGSLNVSYTKVGDVDTFRETISVTSNSTKIIIDIINMVLVGVIANTVSALGIFGNIINIVVFFTQGLRTTVNISFFSLAISDLCNLITIAWFSICVNPYLNADPDLIIFPPEFQHLTAGFPHACFARITAWITVFMTVERCLCITFPFQIKEMITPKRTVITIICIYLFVIAAMIPEYLYVYIDWKVYPNLNKTLLGIVFITDRAYLEGLSFLLYSILMVSSFIAVVFFTGLLVFKLKQKNELLSGKKFSQSNLLSRREKMAVVTVLVLASVFIVTFTPTLLFSILGFAIPGFSISGKYRDVFFIFGYVAFAFDASNASVNIILYYILNSSYRHTLHRLFFSRKV